MMDVGREVLDGEAAIPRAGPRFLAHCPKADVHLHGRDRELTTLIELVDSAKRGCGGMAIVEGEAGIGKTRLVAEALAAAEVQGFQVYYGRCEQLERLRPFAAVAEAFDCARASPDPRLAAIARLVCPAPEEAGDLAEAGTLQYRAVEAFLELVEHLCVARPVAIALEDLHWADDPTLLTARLLARRVQALPVMVLATLRPVPTSPGLTSLVETCLEDGALSLPLQPLVAEAVDDLVGEALGAPPGPRLRSQVAGAAGNPLFIIELARGLAEEKLVSSVAGHAEVEDIQAPPTLRLTILRRLGTLSEPTLQLLRLATVLGRSFTVMDLATVLDRPAKQLVTALEEAQRAGVLGECGERLTFRHELVHEALYQEWPVSVRAGLHGDVARALSAAGASALQVAQHLVLGSSPGDVRAVETLRRAAGEAAARAPSMAAELLARAIELSDSASADRDTLLAERVTALLWSGRVAESAALADEVLRRAHDPHVEGSLRLARGRALFIVGRIEEGLRVLDLTDDGRALTPAERAQLHADRAYGNAMSGHLDKAEGFARHARKEADSAASEDLAWCVATSASSLVAFFRGDLAPAIDLARDAVSRAETSPSPLARRYPVHYFLAAFLLEADRFDAAQDVVLSGRRMNEEWGNTWVLPMLEWVSAARRFLIGDWDDALTDAEAGLAMAGEGGSRQGLHCAEALVGLLAACRVGPVEAQLGTEADSGQPGVSASGVLLGLAGMVHGLLTEARGSPQQALAELEESWQRATEAGAVVDYRLLGPELVRLALASGAVERAQVVTAAVEQVADRMGTAGARGAALRCRGLVDTDPDVLLSAVAAYGRGGRPVERAFALEEAGTALGASDRWTEAVATLEEALAVYEQLGATVAAARLEVRLRTAGVSRGARRRRRPRHGWEALTPSEERVVAQVARGLTNAQIAEALFVSRHTVESHVSHVFAKLGVASRAELAARAVGRGLSPP